MKIDHLILAIHPGSGRLQFDVAFPIPPIGWQANNQTVYADDLVISAWQLPDIGNLGDEIVIRRTKESLKSARGRG